MEFGEIVKQRFATKKFDGKIVPDEKIEQIKECIRLAPSTINAQPWHIIIVKDNETKEKLRTASMNQEQITTCSHLFVFCTRTDAFERFEELKQVMVQSGTPAQKAESFVKMALGWAQSVPKEQHLPWMQRQVYIALSNALNGAKSLGLDSCPMEGFDPIKYSEILNLPNNIIPTVLCPIGYAVDTAKPKVRYADEDVFEEV